MRSTRALRLVPSRVFLLYRGIIVQDYSTKNRPVLGLGCSFGEPQDEKNEQVAPRRIVSRTGNPEELWVKWQFAKDRSPASQGTGCC
jgi:hypothetical protein